MNGLSDDGGFEEFFEFFPTRASSASTRANNAAITASRSATCARNAAMTASASDENDDSDT